MGLRDKIKANLGSGQPPMISRQGNRFTLRDAAGNERDPTLELDVIIVDGNGHVSKQYREDQKFDANNPTPPDCFSDNGVAPSINALKPQSDACITCRWNERNSGVSKLTGKGVKACSDNQKLAVIVVGDAQHILYQLLITPGNLSGFRAYVRTLSGANYDLDEVVTRLTFEAKSMGVLIFNAVASLDDTRQLPQGPELAALVQQYAGSAQAAYVTGEDDQPRQGALPAPRQEPVRALPSQPANAAPTPAEIMQQQTGGGGPKTREELEAILAEMRANDSKPVRSTPKLASVPPAKTPAAEVGSAEEIPAFLRREKMPAQGPSTNFGLVSNASRPPDDPPQVAQAQEPVQNAMEARLAKAFSLPVRG